MVPSKRIPPDLWHLELNAMKAVCRALAPLPPRSQASVLQWVANYFEPKDSVAQQRVPEHALHPAAAERLQVPTLHELSESRPFVPYPPRGEGDLPQQVTDTSTSAELRRDEFVPVLAPAMRSKASPESALVQMFPILKRLARGTRRR